LFEQQAAVYGTKIFRKAQQAKASSPKLPENLFQKIYFYNFLSQIFWSSSEIFVPKPNNEVAFIGYVELVEFALINIQNG
jgi:hypothetical protein